MDRRTFFAIALAAIITIPAQADDDLISIGIGRDRAYAGGLSLGDQSTTQVMMGFGSRDGLGLDIGYLDFGELQRTGPGSFGVHAWTAGLSYTTDITRRFDAIFGFGSYWSGSALRDDHHGYWQIGARYWVSSRVALSARFMSFDQLLGERHKVSSLNLDWTF
jgi:hypothetical protein